MITTEVLDRFGDLVSTIGSDRFGTEFYRLFDDALGIQECTVFSFPAPDRPNRLVVEGNSEDGRRKALELASDYVSGGFRVDPNVRQLGKVAGTAIYLAQPDQISDEAYRAHYYDSVDTAHELVMLGRAGETFYYSSFYRRRSASAFGNEDLRTLQSVSAFVLKALHRHDELCALLDVSDDTIEARAPQRSTIACEQREFTRKHMEDVLLSGGHGLSRREAEICASIVLGYSTLAISLNLGITRNTVATHRKRGYAKLGICSQNELFARYFTAVKEFEGAVTH